MPLAILQDLAGYWAADYDWRRCEAKLNVLPQFVTEIDGFDIHFIQVRSQLLDHGDGWGRPAAPVTSAVLGHTSHGHPAGDLTRDDILDNITLYWLTNTAVSSARLYWENKLGLYNAADVPVPAAVSAFPGENYQAPGAGRSRPTTTSSTTTSPTKAGTSRPGNNRRSSRQRSARA